MNKRILSALLAMTLCLSCVVGLVPASAAAGGSAAPSTYVELDGDWHFRQYRTYGNMFEDFASQPELAAGKTTDAEAAVLPAEDVWTGWPAVSLPDDNPETGGLLTNEVQPAWTEAWAVRSFNLPEKFTDAETVTLLLGIVDDNDVVYLNGKPVACSGFVDGDGKPVTADKIPETGGFAYDAKDKADQVRWEKSCSDAEREYEIPASALVQGGENVIAIRMYNDNGFGGFYSGHVYALCANETAVRTVKGLPTTQASDADARKVLATVSVQLAAVGAQNAAAYAATVAENYHNDAAVKQDRVNEIAELIKANPGLTMTDANSAVYKDVDGHFWYSADRTVTVGSRTVSSGPVEICYEVSETGAMERGNWNRCYADTYDSALFKTQLGYSVYLPPSYYTDAEKEYPTVWLLHGRGASSASFRDVDNIGAFMDDLIAKGTIQEMVLIMPDSGKTAFYSDTTLDANNPDSTGPWRTQLVDELRKEAESRYRLLTEAGYRALTGIDVGGYGAVMAATTHPELYTSLAVHMGYLPEDARESFKNLTNTEMAALDIYLDVGKQDSTVGTDDTQALHDYLDSVSKTHTFDLRDGGHNSAFYMAGLAASMKVHSDHFKAYATRPENLLVSTQGKTTTVRPDIQAANGAASWEADDAACKDILDQAKANAVTTVAITPKVTGTATRVEAVLPAATVASLGKDTKADLRLETSFATVILPNAALAPIATGGKVAIMLEQTNIGVAVTLTADSRSVESVTGGILLQVPCEYTPGTVAFLLKDGNQKTVIPTSYVDARDKICIVPLAGSGSIQIQDNAKTFKDVKDSYWGKDAIAFATGHELFNGTSATTFDPAVPMTRGMLMTLLARLSGQDTTGGETWYSKGLAWAVKEGISDGTNPNNPITREQLAEMLYRYSGRPEGSASLSGFKDASKVSSFAQDGVRWAYSTGLMQGKSETTLDPLGQASRAEVAQLLMRYIQAGM